MDSAATKIQSIFRGIHLRAQWEEGLHVKPYRHDCLLEYDAEGEALADMMDIDVSVKTGRLAEPWWGGGPNWTERAYTVTDALNEGMIKWLLRYDQAHLLRLSYKASATTLVEGIVEHQKARLCAISQVLAAKHVPREVFAGHCGGLDIGGANLLVNV